MDCLSKIGSSYIYYDSKRYGCDKIYRDYYVSVIKTILTRYPDLNLNIICGDDCYTFDNENKTIRVEFNYEHTLVQQGGRDSYGAVQGNIMAEYFPSGASGESMPYLVRIDRYNILNIGDIIIDYSIPNIVNIRSVDIYNDFLKRMVYISPSIYELHFKKENRSIDILTTFIKTDQPRRAELIRRLQPLPHVNRNDCFEKEALQELYKNTKILINIHQTDHHHTFEELRVLPALECGVIVISEISPLHTHVPYHDYIIWETYDGIIDKVKDIFGNYDRYYDMIFNTPKMVKLEELHDANIERLSSAVLSASNIQM
jgi:hypothetical protein